MRTRTNPQATAAKAFIRCALMLTISMILVLAFVCIAQDSTERAKMNQDPNAAKLVTSDLGNFWRAYALASVATTAADKEKIFQREYLDSGSPGLKDFIKARISSSKNLVQAIEAHPKYYASLQEVTPRVVEMEPAIRTSLRKLKDLYTDAVFPDVYFLIGIMNSGGTTADSGLLIGFEMHGKTPATDMSEMGNWHKAVLGPPEELPGIVAHELIHYQQGREGKTLLEQSIHEGSADFVGELISGQTTNKAQRVYGDAHEADLWAEFSKEMNGTDFSHWLYQGDKSKDRPADLGYYIGVRIAESYYLHSTDKKQAIRDILTVTDYQALLHNSQYAEKFSAHTPSF